MAKILTDPVKGIWGGYTTVTQKPVSRPSIGGGIAPEAESALQRAKAYYEEGGGFGAGVEAGLERGRVKSVAAGTQSLVSAGLAGTTMVAGLGKKYEEEVAMPARAGVEETRAQAISGIESLRAQMIQGATESARARSLQDYLARLAASSQSYRDAIQAALAGQVQPGAGGGAGGVDAGGGVGGVDVGGGYEYPSAPSLISGGGGGVNIPTTMLEPATSDMYTLLGAGTDDAGSEEDYQAYLSSKLAASQSAHEKEYAGRPREHPQYQAGYAAWRKWKGYVD